jgi:hypothetical protein
MLVDQPLTKGAPTGRAWQGALAVGALLTLTLLLLWPQAASAGGAIVSVQSSHETMEAVRWGFLIGAALEFVFVVILKRAVLKVIIGADGRVSTSKTIATVWTFVVAAAMLALVYADLLNHNEALEATNAAGVVGQYALLFGGPLGAAILSKAIVSGQVKDDARAKPPAGSSGLSDLITNDAGQTDLGDLQYLLFNVVALVFVLGTMLVHEPGAGLPHIPDVLLGLTSVSAAGYVGKKLLPPQLLTAGLAKNKGKAGENVAVGLQGIPAPSGQEADFWVRFGVEEGKLAKAPVVNGAAEIEVPVPRLEPTPTKPVAVTVVTEAGAMLNAGTFEYE